MKYYKNQISVHLNRKGILDIDSVKGCTFGTTKYENGCYGVCYANKTAKLYNYDFTHSVTRNINYKNINQLCLFNDMFFGDNKIINILRQHKLGWFRIGTMGDPSHDWVATVNLCLWLHKIRVPVVVTKHWIEIPEYLLTKFKQVGAVINTSISALDTMREIKYRLHQFKRIGNFGIKSILRIVSCEFGKTEIGVNLSKIQDELFKYKPIIDNPLRISKDDKRVYSGDIVIKLVENINTKSSISIFNKNAYIGECSACPDQCGLTL